MPKGENSADALNFRLSLLDSIICAAFRSELFDCALGGLGATSIVHLLDSAGEIVGVFSSSPRLTF